MAPQPQENNDVNGPGILDLYVTLVQFGFQTGCSIDLHDLACKGLNVELKVTINRVVQMAIRKPSITAAITEKGKVFCNGIIQEHEAYMAARRVARQLQRVNPRVKFTKFRIIQVFACCPFSYKINLIKLAKLNPIECIYEPELGCHAHFKFDKLKVSANIYASGKANFIGQSLDAIKIAIKYLLEVVPKCKLEEEKRKPVLTDLSSNKPIGKRASAPALNPPNRGVRSRKKRVNENDENKENMPVDPPKNELKETKSDQTIGYHLRSRKRKLVEETRSEQEQPKVMKEEPKSEQNIQEIASDDVPKEKETIDDDHGLDFSFLEEHFGLEKIQTCD